MSKNLNMQHQLVKDIILTYYSLQLVKHLNLLHVRSHKSNKGEPFYGESNSNFNSIANSNCSFNCKSNSNSFELFSKKLDTKNVQHSTLLSVGKVYNLVAEIPEVSLDVILHPSIVRSWAEKSQEQ